MLDCPACAGPTALGGDCATCKGTTKIDKTTYDLFIEQRNKWEALTKTKNNIFDIVSFANSIEELKSEILKLLNP